MSNRNFAKVLLLYRSGGLSPGSLWPQLGRLGHGTVVRRAKRRFKKYGAARCGLRQQTVFEGSEK